MNMLRLSKKIYLIGAGIIVLLVVGFFSFRKPQIEFEKTREVEINSGADYSKFIKKVNEGKEEDIRIDNSKVDITKLGEYPVVYQLGDYKKTKTIKVVDTRAPEFDVVSKTVEISDEIDPYQLVKNIEDDTKTTVLFKKDYHFKKAGEYEVKVTVKDEAKNEKTKNVKIKVFEDKEPPVITGKDRQFVVGTKIDLKTLVSVEDQNDSNPSLTVRYDHFDNKTIGEYKIDYIAQDKYKNKSKKTLTITMIDKPKLEDKIVYLTFDDGPSKNTPEVLKILKQYGCSATFFITGRNANYRRYIKEAYNQGHTIGLHTYSHNYSRIYASTDAYFNDLEKVGNLAKDYIGFKPQYIRFPGGSSNTVSKQYSKGIMKKLSQMVQNKGYTYYDWNAENGDGFEKMTQKEMIKRGTASQAKKIMMLMHDANGKEDTVKTLPQIIEYYQNRGYVFKAIDETAIVPHHPIHN